jgi:hypothetical protein
MRKRVTAESVVAVAALWGMMTVGLLARHRFGGDRSAARQMLGTLSRTGRLHRHLCRVPGEAECVAYYTDGKKPLGLFALRDRYAIARFCEERTPPATLLSLAALAELFAPIVEAAELPATAVRHAPCFMDASGVGGPSLCRIVTLRERDLSGALTRLERLASGADFAPWWWFARSGRLTLVVLCPGRERAAELSRWLERRTLVSRPQGLAANVPVRVHVAARVRP